MSETELRGTINADAVLLREVAFVLEHELGDPRHVGVRAIANRIAMDQPRIIRESFTDGVITNLLVHPGVATVVQVEADYRAALAAEPDDDTTQVATDQGHIVSVVRSVYRQQGNAL